MCTVPERERNAEDLPKSQTERAVRVTFSLSLLVLRENTGMKLSVALPSGAFLSSVSTERASERERERERGGRERDRQTDIDRDR